MKVAISAVGDNLDALTSPVFGRAPNIVFVDTDTLVYEAIPNPAVSQGGGAGTMAAQTVVRRGVDAVLSGNVGPNAMEVFEAAGVRCYLVPEVSVRQAIHMLQSARLKPMSGSSAPRRTGLV